MCTYKWNHEPRWKTVFASQLMYKILNIIFNYNMTKTVQRVIVCNQIWNSFRHLRFFNFSENLTFFIPSSIMFSKQPFLRKYNFILVQCLKQWCLVCTVSGEFYWIVMKCIVHILHSDVWQSSCDVFCTNIYLIWLFHCPSQKLLLNVLNIKYSNRYQYSNYYKIINSYKRNERLKSWDVKYIKRMY